MAIVPSGLPAWSKTADFQSYGGNLNKVNYQSQGVTNPLTDISAEQHARLCEDTAAISRTAAFADLTVQCNDTVPGPPTITAVDMMTGVHLASYVGNVPPSGFPSGSRNGNGDVTLIFDATPSDDYGVSQSLSLVHAVASVHGTSARTETVAVTANSVRVRIWDIPGGTASVDPKFTVSVAP
jgi:hypothetical protein